MLIKFLKRIVAVGTPFLMGFTALSTFGIAGGIAGFSLGYIISDIIDSTSIANAKETAMNFINCFNPFSKQEWKGATMILGGLGLLFSISAASFGMFAIAPVFEPYLFSFISPILQKSVIETTGATVAGMIVGKAIDDNKKDFETMIKDVKEKHKNEEKEQAASPSPVR